MNFKFYKLQIALLFMLLTSTIIAVQFREPLLDGNILQDPNKVQEILKEHGFKKISFTTTDHLKLYGLLLDQSKSKNIQGTIIFCAGFYPGTKEGMSSFYTLLKDQPYNFLIFDARGHQESQGSLFSYQSLKNYGTCEFQDIVAAIQFLNEYNQAHQIPSSIIIHGICSGAFHTIKALQYLNKMNNNQTSTIKGIIFDSGWLRVSDIVEPTICAEITKRLKNSWFSWLITPLCYFSLQFYRLTLKHHHYNIAGIVHDISEISCPIFFVHCIDDPYVPIKPIQTLVQDCCYPNSWWIHHNSHANFHMKEPEAYKRKIIDFLEKI